LDLPPAERWLFYKSDPAFAEFKTDAIYYLGKFVPKVLLPLLTKLVSTLHSTFYPDYAEEMVGIAKGLDMNLGEVVLINLIYQLEGIANGCELKNTTGLCPPKNGPSLCSGFVANGQGSDDLVWQGRNLDWNLDARLLKYVLQVEYQKNNATLFTGLQIAGMVGTLHGVKKGAFSVQVNARDDGGNVLVNLFEQILVGGKEPTHHMRKALEEATDFKSGEAMLSVGHLVPVSRSCALPRAALVGLGEISLGVWVQRHGVSSDLPDHALQRTGGGKPGLLHHGGCQSRRGCGSDARQDKLDRCMAPL